MSSEERPAATLPEQRDGFIVNGDLQVHYRAYGSGPLIIFLHGFPDNEGTYAAQVLEFARDHLVVTPTLRGYPPSSVPKNREAYGLPVVAEDIRALLDHFNAETAIVAGHDWGGVVAQAFALAYPERVTGVILMNSPVLAPFIALVNSDAEQQELSKYTLAYIEYEDGDDKNVDFVVRNIRDLHWRKTIAEYLRVSPVYGMLNYYKVNYPVPPYGAAPPADDSAFVYHMCTLILWGLEDEYFSIKVLDGLSKWFTQSLRLVTIPRAGHWVHIDQSTIVNREIRSWLDMTRTG
jgi:pimeloyl-ACP methyl ester carboxylesterase